MAAMIANSGSGRTSMNTEHENAMEEFYDRVRRELLDEIDHMDALHSEIMKEKGYDSFKAYAGIISLALNEVEGESGRDAVRRILIYFSNRYKDE
jgi:hypothetical protein